MHYQKYCYSVQDITSSACPLIKLVSLVIDKVKALKSSLCSGFVSSEMSLRPSRLSGLYLALLGLVATPHSPTRRYNSLLSAHPPQHPLHLPTPLYMPLIILEWLWRTVAQNPAVLQGS